MTTEATGQSDFIAPPRAGEIAVIAVSAVAGSQDLAAVGPQGSNQNDQDRRPTVAAGTVGPGLVGHYATFFADGADVYVCFGSASAAVTGANVPVAATNGINAAGCAIKIVSGQSLPWKIRVQDRYIGFVASGAGQLRVYRSSV